MIRHLFKMVWNRRRTNALIILEILFSFLVLFGVTTLGVYYLNLYQQMEQVFVNICKNAIEAIRANGSITIRMYKESTRGLVVVEDTGCGIPTVMRGNLFSPFFTTKENGQGIGLTLVQEILSQHHFDFSLEGQPSGPTRFTVYF